MACERRDEDLPGNVLTGAARPSRPRDESLRDAARPEAGFSGQLPAGPKDA